MKKIIKKVLRSIFYIVVMSVLAFLPDFWLWHIGVSEWPLLLAILWWVPSLLLVLAEVVCPCTLYYHTFLGIP